MAINVRYRVAEKKIQKHRYLSRAEKQIHILQIEILLGPRCSVKQIHILYVQEIKI